MKYYVTEQIVCYLASFTDLTNMNTSTRNPINCQFGVCFFLFILVLPCLPAQSQEIGPKQGTLLLGGGNLQDVAIFKRFIEHAGGADAHIVVIPTAGGQATYDQYWQGLNVRSQPFDRVQEKT